MILHFVLVSLLDCVDSPNKSRRTLASGVETRPVIDILSNQTEALTTNDLLRKHRTGGFGFGVVQMVTTAFGIIETSSRLPVLPAPFAPNRTGLGLRCAGGGAGKVERCCYCVWHGDFRGLLLAVRRVLGLTHPPPPFTPLSRVVVVSASRRFRQSMNAAHPTFLMTEDDLPLQYFFLSPDERRCQRDLIAAFDGPCALCVGGGVLWLACVGLLIVSGLPLVVAVPLFLCLSVSRCLCLSLSQCFSLSLAVSVSRSLAVSLSLSRCLSVSLSRCLSVSLSLCLSVLLSRCLTASLSRCRVVYLSHCIDSFHLPSVSSSLCFS